MIRPGREPGTGDSISRNGETPRVRSAQAACSGQAAASVCPTVIVLGSTMGAQPWPGVLREHQALEEPWCPAPCAGCSRYTRQWPMPAHSPHPALTSSPSLHLSAIPGGWSGVPCLPTLRRAGCGTNTGALQSTDRASWAERRDIKRDVTGGVSMSFPRPPSPFRNQGAVPGGSLPCASLHGWWRTQSPGMDGFATESLPAGSYPLQHL